MSQLQPSSKSPILVALDFHSSDQALRLVEQLDNRLCRLKVGKELFTRCGPAFIEQLHLLGFEVFLDMKFHDIPNTVAQAVDAAADLGVWMVNLHASGGRRMMEAARNKLEQSSGPRPLLIGVTVLTSMDADDFAELGYNFSVNEQVMRLAALTQDCGLDGVVCSSQEAASLKKAHGTDFVLVTPGIRPAGSERDDQKRVMTPVEALRNGSDYLVIGRPITQSSDPLARLQQIYDDIVAMS